MRDIRITEELIDRHPEFWTSQANGGYSLNQRQNSNNGSVLPNCTGMSTGLFNLNHYLKFGERDKDAERYLIYEAQNYWWQVTEGNLKGKYRYGKEPKEGGLMVWSGTDGNGHVCYVNAVTEKGVEVIQSSYKGNRCYFFEEITNANDNWSYNQNYRYLGCIYAKENESEDTEGEEMERNMPRDIERDGYDIRISVANLLKVKSIISLTLTGVVAYLAIAGKYQNFEDIYLMIISFFFGTAVAKK